MDSKNKALHIAMLPWSAFGHLIPFLSLAKLLAQKGHSISFISTPKNIKRLPKIPSNLTDQIHFIEFSLPAVSGLPPGAEATSDLAYTEFNYLKLAYDGLQPQLVEFLESSSPDWLIIDFAPYWAIPVASKLGIRTAFFSIFKASSLVFVGPFETLDEDDKVKHPDCYLECYARKSVEDWTVKPKWVTFESEMAFRYFEIAKMFDNLVENFKGIRDGQRFGTVMRNCDVIAVRSCSEFEPEWIELLQNISGTPVRPIGFLPPATSDEDPGDAWQPVKDWLDRWPQGYVIYVAFGSEATLTSEELTELALGLEKSELPFCWALKTQEKDLPEGFKERTKERGVVWTSWVPQLRVLSHDSVGGFLSHSGWSSVIEGIVLQKPLILFTLFSDQGLVARVLEEKKLGYSIPREEKDGSFTRDSVANSLRKIVLEKEGNMYKENINQMSRLFGDIDKQAQYIDEFSNYLQAHMLEKK